MSDDDDEQPDAWGLYHTRVHKEAGRARPAKLPKRRDPDLNRTLATMRGVEDREQLASLQRVTDADDARRYVQRGDGSARPGDSMPAACPGCQELRRHLAALIQRVDALEQKRLGRGYPEAALLASRGGRRK